MLSHSFRQTTSLTTDRRLLDNPLYRDCVEFPTDIFRRQLLADDLIVKGQVDLGEYILDCINRNVHTESVYGQSWFPFMGNSTWLYWRYGMPSVLRVPAIYSVDWWLSLVTNFCDQLPIGLVYFYDTMLLPEQKLIFYHYTDSRPKTFVYQFDRGIHYWYGTFERLLGGNDGDVLRRHGNLRPALDACVASIRDRRRLGADGGLMAATIQGHPVIDPYNDGEYIRWVQQQLRPIPLKQDVQYVDVFRDLLVIADQPNRRNR